MGAFTVSEESQKANARADNPISVDRSWQDWAGIVTVGIGFRWRIRELWGAHGRGLRQPGWFDCGKAVVERNRNVVPEG